MIGQGVAVDTLHPEKYFAHTIERDIYFLVQVEINSGAYLPDIYLPTT